MYNLYAKFEKILEICKQFSQGLVDERGNVLRRSPTPKFSDLEVIALPYGVEGFATPKHLVKEDGTTAKVDEKLPFKVIEFNKDAKRIILSHSRIHEDAAKTVAEEPKKAVKKAKKEEAPAIEKTTLGDLDALSALKNEMVAAATEKLIKKEAAKKTTKAEKAEEPAAEKPAKKATKAKKAEVAESEEKAEKKPAKKATKKAAPEKEAK